MPINTVQMEIFLFSGDNFLPLSESSSNILFKLVSIGWCISFHRKPENLTISNKFISEIGRVDVFLNGKMLVTTRKKRVSSKSKPIVCKLTLDIQIYIQITNTNRYTNSRN